MPTENQRRLLLLGGMAAFVGAWQIVPRLVDRFSDRFDFVELSNPQGFRKLSDGDISGGLDIFAGLDNGPVRDLTGARQKVRENLDQYLFADRADGDALQIAYFSDFYCPYCRVQSGELIEIAQTANIDISWHETPIFGPTSELAAKAAIAAGEQGKYVDFHKRLNAAPVAVTPPYLDILAQKMGLDLGRFQQDLASEVTLSKLDISAVLAETFGFFATPAIVIGRTAILGRMSATNIRQLIEIERHDAGLA